MAVTFLSDLNSLFPLIYERSLLTARELNLMAGLVTNRGATGFMNRIVSTRATLSAAAVADTADLTPSTFSKTSSVTLTPAEIGVSVALSDKNMETDPDSTVQDAVLELGGAIATKIDVDLVAEFGNFTTDKGPGAGLTATLADAGAAIAVLNNNKARQFGRLYAVWHPYHWHDLWVELGTPAATFANMDALTSQALRDYYVADLLGALHFTSSNIAVDVSDDAVSGLFNMQALMLDTRRAVRFETDRDISFRHTEIVATAAYAVGRYRDSFGVGYTADALEPT